MKYLLSKENTNITLASIGADKVASCIDATTTQVFDVKMKKDSSNEESDGDDTNPDYGGDERVSVLSDEEGEQTAKGNIVTPVTTEGDDAQATQTSNPGEAIGDDTAETQEDKDGDDDDKSLQALEMAPFHMILQSLQQEESAKAHQTMCLSE